MRKILFMAVMVLVLASSSTWGQDFNTVTTTTYDASGAVTSKSKTYQDDLGRLVQQQTLDVKTNKVWTNETKYDSQGRPVIQTLSAPVNATGSFTYQSNFMRKSNGTAYTAGDFESNMANPPTVGTQTNTLGWYYSDSNSSEAYQDATGHPFTATEYSTLNPGTPLRAIGGNKINGQWPQGYSFSMPASQELSQTVAFGSSSYNNIETVKTVTRDVHGVENVLFSDTEGKLLAAAHSGGTGKRSMSIDIGEQGYVDIHVPAGSSMGFTVSTNGNAVTTHNLITEATVSPSNSLPNGFYRVSVNDPDTYNTSNPVTVNYQENYYDYALNEYDEVGRLIHSYQPLGTTKAAKPRTDYEYNTLGQLVYTKSPDEGKAWFKYREDGQIRYSQNEKQQAANQISYTDYDPFGRPVESGVASGVANFSALNPDATLSASYTRSEVTVTKYDFEPAEDHTSGLGSRASQYPIQHFLSGNVAYTANDESETWYSYDVYGRVEWLVQTLPHIGTKTIDYEYEPTTGLMTKVIYQKGASDQFVHKYEYNELDQLEFVRTSTNGTSFNLRATYSYYETGGLKRIEYGNGLQGVDYVYNLAGQLKSINHPSLSGSDDPGGDTDDIFGMQLDYHSNDYNRPSKPEISSTTYGTNRLSGDIKGIRWNNKMVNQQAVYKYEYDRNRWLTEAAFGHYSEPDGSVDPDVEDVQDYGSSGGNVTKEASNSVTLKAPFHFIATASNSYTAKIVSADGFEEVGNGDYSVTGIEYDANGNLEALKRNKNNAGGNNAMDDLTYVYDRTNPQDGPNQLLQVQDAAGNASGANDIDTQGSNNYSYNAIGQMTRNNAENLDYFYNASGLVTEVRQNGQPLAKFFYNNRGHRVKKEAFANNGNLESRTVYVRDVSGSIMATYYTSGSGTPALAEHTIYGSGRLGLKKADGTAFYEISDHLGNVRAVFTQVLGSLQDDFNDYYPFGMLMPNRNSVSNADYRYAFQGQEKDAKTEMEAFEARFWDARIGRWLTADPLGEFFSPYLGMGNNPVNLIDPDGRCTKCPKDAKVGDTFEHPDYGTLTYTTNGWGNDSAGFVLDDLYIFGSRSAMEAGVGVVGRSNDMSWTDFEMAWRLEVGRLKNRQQAINMALFAGLSAEVFGIASFSPQQQVLSTSTRFVGPMTKVQTTVIVTETSVPLLAPVKTVKHHIFNVFRGASPKSQKYRDFFKKHNIDINAHTVEIAEETHKIVHGSGNNWTTKWKRWIDANPNATTKEVYQQAGKMMDEYGLSHIPIVKY